MKRVLQEESEHDSNDKSHPLLHLMHGRPGVGKSHVLKKIREFFEEIMGWSIGTEFNITALQAVMAVAVGGETLHHVAGINPFTASDAVPSMEQHMSAERMAKRMLEMRWLIIDEISMISTNFLAQVDMKLRGAIREQGTYKVDGDGKVRSFGGLNVLFAGDFCQLDPPEGVPICSVPKDLLTLRKEVKPSGTATHGQQIFWGKSSLSVTGMTELTQPHRCKDKWYNEFLEECRAKQLTADNHSFIHGYETSVPGSWLKGAPQCKKRECAALPARWEKDKARGVPWEKRQAQECATCQGERRKRCRVAVDEKHQEFAWPKFLKAPAIVANNDVKYDTNKKRAAQFAHRQRQSIFWCIAKDNVTLDALRDNPSLPEKKRDWLQRHDRECSDLYGMFPLIKGMPVALTDHIDRNPEKNLLRGCVGHVHSWILHQDDQQEKYPNDVLLQKLPQVVFVKFKGAKWKLPGMKEAGVYPIRPVKRTWALDKNRAVPRLKIIRRQLPLAPAFAMTAHASQGQTLEAAIVDLMIGKETSPQTSYVALSRVRKREDILIFRPFPREIFTRQAALGPELLLQHLRGEAIDWAELQERLKQSTTKRRKKATQTLRKCAKCSKELPESDFNKSQLGQQGRLRKCNSCLANRQTSENLLCSACGEELSKDKFSESQLEHYGQKRKCKDCIAASTRDKKNELLLCAACGKRMPRDRFGKSQADRKGQKRKCKDCIAALTCGKCHETKPKREFTDCPAKRSGKHRRCNACWQAHLEEEQQSMRNFADAQ